MGHAWPTVLCKGVCAASPGSSDASWQHTSESHLLRKWEGRDRSDPIGPLTRVKPAIRWVDTQGLESDRLGLNHDFDTHT